jgi:FtsH-binding integral membrane protein
MIVSNNGFISLPTPKKKSILKTLFVEGIGWFGAITAAVLYGMQCLHLITVESPLYIVLTLLAAVGVFCVSVARRAWQPAFVNLAFFVFTLFTILNAYI